MIQKMSTIISDELYHYGVKGMKWGVRRSHKNVASISSSKKRKSETESDVSDNQTTKKKRLSDKQKKAIKVGAIAAGAVLMGYGAYKLSNSRYFDRTVKIGKDFYRQGHKNEVNEGLNELVYATFKKQDAKKYAFLVDDGIGYKIRSGDSVKIAGTKTAESIYKELINNNEKFRSHYGDMSYKDFNGSLGWANKMIIEQNKLYGKTLKDTYMSPFFDELRTRGYGAVVDTQDKFAKIPVILLNSANEYKIVN